MQSVNERSRYKKMNNLGSGSFGFVELCTDTERNRLVAIKFIPRGLKITKYVLHEILNHSRLRHPHIVNFREVFMTPKYLAIVTDFVPGGDMFTYVSCRGGVTEDNARWFFQQIITGVDYLHKMGLAHRDIKLENMLLDNSPKPLVKICDFGYSKHADYQSAARSRVGTPSYLAPEVLFCKTDGHYDGKLADVWSCGVVLFVMIAGGYPFVGHGEKGDREGFQKWMQSIVKLEYKFPDKVKTSAELQDLLAKILVVDPTQRATLSEIQAHPWFLKNLPDGVSAMNKHLLLPTIEQTEADLRDLVREAQRDLADHTDVSLSKEEVTTDALDRIGLTSDWINY